MKKQHHEVEIAIHATPEATWKIIGAVSGVDLWLEPIKTCRVDGDKRYCSTEQGSFEEDIKKVDHKKRELHYAIPEQNMIPVKNIVGMMKVKEAKDGNAVVLWQWDYEVEEKNETQAREMLSGTGEMGIRGIEKLAAAQV